MNYEKALIMLRPDLTLQVSCREQVIDVTLDASMALGLVVALLARIAPQQPWFGRADGAVLARAHDAAFTLTHAVAMSLSRPPLSAEATASAVRLLQPAFLAASAIALVTFDEMEGAAPRPCR